ncbi:MAG: cysteine hydrolase family protein [Candidatus Binatia bacterium]
MKDVHPIYANPANSILVVINMQNEFCKPGGIIHDERPVKEMPQIIGVVKTVTQKAREVGIPIIHIQSTRSSDEPEFTVYGNKPIIKAGSWGAEIVAELKPQERDVVVAAWWQDPFYKSKLNHIVEGLVEEPTKSHAILVGGDIVGALYLTAMGFYLRNHWVVVPIDAIYGDQDGHEFALNQFSKSSLPNIFLTRSDLIELSSVPEPAIQGLMPNT